MIQNKRRKKKTYGSEKVVGMEGCEYGCGHCQYWCGGRSGEKKNGGFEKDGLYRVCCDHGHLEKEEIVEGVNVDLS